MKIITCVYNQGDKGSHATVIRVGTVSNKAGDL